MLLEICSNTGGSARPTVSHHHYGRGPSLPSGCCSTDSCYWWRQSGLEPSPPARRGVPPSGPTFRGGQSRAYAASLAATGAKAITLPCIVLIVSICCCLLSKPIRPHTVLSRPVSVKCNSSGAGESRTPVQTGALQISMTIIVERRGIKPLPNS